MQVERYDITVWITAERRRGATSVSSEVEYQWVLVGEGEGEGEVLEQAVMIITARKLEEIEGRVVAYLCQKAVHKMRYAQMSIVGLFY